MNGRTLFVPLTALLLGIAIGWGLAPSESTVEPSDLARIDEDHTVGGSIRSATERPDLAIDESSGRAAPRIADDTVIPHGAIERALARVAVGDAPQPTGNGVLTGVVRDRNGLGIAGVQVAVRNRPRTNAYATGLDPDPPPAFRGIEAVLAEAADGWSSGRSGLRRTTTDERGAFRFEDLVDDQPLWIDVHHPDLVFERMWGARSTHPGMHHEFTAYRRVPVTFVVRDESGAPVDRALVRVELGRRDRWLVPCEWTPDRATFDLTEGDAMVWAVSGWSGSAHSSYPRQALRNARAASAARSIRIEDSMETVELVLVRAPSLTVRPVLTGRVPASFRPRVEVRQLGVPEGEPVERRFESLYDLDRDLVFGDLPQGSYVVRLLGPRGDDALREVEARVEDGEGFVELPVPPIEECRPVRVRVRSHDGEIVERCEFQRLHLDPEGQVVPVRRDSTRGGAGWYEVEFDQGFVLAEPPPDSAADLDPKTPRPTRTLRVVVSHVGLAEVEVPRGARELEVTLPAPAQLSVTLPIDWVGDPSVRLSLALDHEGGLQQSLGYRVSNESFGEDGRLVLEGVPPARYVLTVRGSRTTVDHEALGFPGSGLRPGRNGFQHQEVVDLHSGLNSIAIDDLRSD